MALANQPVKKGFTIVSAFVVTLRCSYLFPYLIMMGISIIPSLLFFIAKKSNQKTLVQLIASGYLNASAFLDAL